MRNVYIVTHNKRNRQRGFTLIELLMVTAIFSITIVLAVDIFLLVTKVQRKTVTSQRLQGDARFVMELIAKDVRLGELDYSFYTSLAAQCGVGGAPPDNAECDVDLSQPTDVLAVRDAQGELIIYRRTDAQGDTDWSTWDNPTGDGIEVCIGDCLDDALSVWETITPRGIKVVGSQFLIRPAASPFVAGGPNQQPLVMIRLSTQGVGSQIEEQGYIFLQTTTSTRIYER